MKSEKELMDELKGSPGSTFLGRSFISTMLVIGIIITVVIYHQHK